MITYTPRCGACFRDVTQRNGGVMHMVVDSRVVCGATHVQAYVMVSLEDTEAMQRRIAELESRLEAAGMSEA